MKPASKFPTALCLGGIALLAGAVFLLNNPAPKKARECECFERMIPLWMATFGYAYDQGFAGNSRAWKEPVPPEKLAPFLKWGTEATICPKTRVTYPQFILEDGPSCPNGHGKAIDVLASALADKNHHCRKFALEAIGYEAMAMWLASPSSALIEGLITVLEQEEGIPRSRAALSLQLITRQKFGHDAAAWRSWWRENKQDFWQRPRR